MKPFKTFRIIFLLLILPAGFWSCHQTENFRSSLDLSGYWQFSPDIANVGIEQNWFSKELTDSVELPGTTDINHKGFKNTDTTTYHLNRLYKYEGPAWYKKTVMIPDDWKSRHIQLILERTKPAKVWIDNHYIGESFLLESPQKYDLSKYLTPGKHIITIRVDNRLSLTPYGNVHIYSDDTQTNWNGILGTIALEASDKTYISGIRVYPDIDNQKIKVQLSLHSESAPEKIDVELQVTKESGKRTKRLKSSVYTVPCDSIIELEYHLGKNTGLWDEYQQPLYRLHAVIRYKDKVKDNKTVSFGMRKFAAEGTQFTINNRITFLRGKHDACVFPLTGFPPMDAEGWIKIFNIAKSYGINHYRFHSWCPPEAAFEAADRTGIYIQAELPFWGGLESDTVAERLKEEGLALLQAYANHPSFVMFSPGNEIWSGHQRIKKIIDELKTYDNRPLYTQGSNNNIGYVPPMEGTDFQVAARTPSNGDTSLTHIRLSHGYVDSREGGILNSQKPSTDFNYSFPVSTMNMPLVSHEIGQYQIYPDFKEIDKYTGVLRAWNFEIFKKRLEKAGMIDQNSDFTKASGAWSALCYKAEIEAALRTPGFAGFQLLDLQDFPGQGTALVGILDAFMESKNVISREEWRQFCNDVVPLLLFDKYCWTSAETFAATVQVANYSDRKISGNVKWSITGENKRVIKEGSFEKNEIPLGGLTTTGKIEVPLASISKAEKLIVKLHVENTGYENTYSIWVFPEAIMTDPTGITIAENLNSDIWNKLENGEKVLLFPKAGSVRNSVGGLFTPDFWNYGMFKGISEWAKKPVSPGTLGILTNPEHPLFNYFPTDFHTNWQWWSVIKAANPMVLDSTGHEYRPIVQVIDNVERNHKLGLIFEFRVGDGKLLVCMSRLNDIMEQPEAAQLYHSVVEYMKSDEFRPEYVLDENMAEKLFLIKQ